MLISLSKVVCKLPIRWVLCLGRLIGLVWYYLFPLRVKVARRNVERAFGDSLTPKQKRRIVRKSCEQLSMTIVEGFRLPMLERELAEGRMEIEGLDLLHNLHRDGRGVCLVALHLGNFEMAIGAIALAGLPLSVIYKDINWKPAHEFWNHVRQTTGVNPIPPRRSKKQILQALTNRGIVLFAIDQHMVKYRAIICTFMDNLVSTTPAVPKFATETNAAVVYFHTYRKAEDPSQHVLKLEEFKLESPFLSPEENIRHNTQRLNDLTETIVRAHPEQWLWQHKRFKVQDNPGDWDIPPHLQHLVKPPPA